MIVFDLECRAGGHRFEGWFASSAAFAQQAERGLVDCPECGSPEVVKAPMAPRLARKGNQVETAPRAAPAPAPASSSAPAVAEAQPAAPPPPSPAPPPEVLAAMHALAALQAATIKESRWVGGKFAEESRAMHYGEREVATIHGQASRAEAEELLDEGILIAPLLIPFAPPDERN